jgi:hypothetical protein
MGIIVPTGLLALIGKLSAKAKKKEEKPREK